APGARRGGVPGAARGAVTVSRRGVTKLRSNIPILGCSPPREQTETMRFIGNSGRFGWWHGRCRGSPAPPTSQRGCPMLETQPRLSPSDFTDQELLQRMLERDGKAWREFYRRFDRLIYRCIHKVTGRFRHSVGPDDVQEI